jgi:Tfp pilus assembly protein PilF
LAVQQHDRDRAITNFQRAVDLDPQQPAFHDNLARAQTRSNEQVK